MAKERTTLSIDADILRATRVAAARTGRRDSEVVEDALRNCLASSSTSCRSDAVRRALRS
jgi:metal-responsive CopG/Arc/MetJ family transcriptional regulator